MNKDEIIRMAQKAGITVAESFHAFAGSTEDLERFAALVAAHEREACAQLCEDLWEDDGTAWDCAVAIESRGNK